METLETVSQDLYQQCFDKLDEFYQNTVEMELEARLANRLQKWHDVLSSEAIKYDAKQSKKKTYNTHALGMYLEGIKNAIKNPDFLKNPRKALAGEFLIKDETGGIYHRNLPESFDHVKFSLPFLNSAIKKNGQNSLKNPENII